MVALKTPLVDMEVSEEAALYIGVLERQVLGLTVNELKYRALLEMLTGEQWDDLKTDMEAGELEKIAIEATMRKLGVTNAKAREIVRERKALANQEGKE